MFGWWATHVNTGIPHHCHVVLTKTQIVLVLQYCVLTLQYDGRCTCACDLLGSPGMREGGREEEGEGGREGGREEREEG